MKHFAILILAVVASAVVMAYPESDSAKDDGNQEKEKALLVKVQERSDDGDYDEYDNDETTHTPDPSAPTARPRIREHQA
uniref:Madanin-like n=1 Tax=Haemaphysalis longicornis TaxID=44386 RepID=Q4R1A2_HAELO|nr:madanin-like [Haemaphysalis longicornis]